MNISLRSYPYKFIITRNDNRFYSKVNSSELLEILKKCFLNTTCIVMSVIVSNLWPHNIILPDTKCFINLWNKSLLWSSIYKYYFLFLCFYFQNLNGWSNSLFIVWYNFRRAFHTMCLLSSHKSMCSVLLQWSRRWHAWEQSSISSYRKFNSAQSICFIVVEI